MAKILVIEDDSNLRQLYQEVLTENGFEVLAAGNGEEGVVKIKSEHPDLILLDLVMPKVSGFDVIKQVKQDPRTASLPIIILSNITIDSEDMIQKGGAVSVLLKADNTPGQVIEKIKSVLKISPT